ncbi:MAG: polysaccharide deacetylase family protein [Candidatus Zixiibacteriota bacterium]
MSGSPESRLVILVFHKLSNKCTFGVSNYPPKRLVRLLDSLRGDGWNLGEAGIGDTPVGQGRGKLTLSFDDGYEHLTIVLPAIMERFRFEPVVFVPSDWIGKSNSWDYSHRIRACPHLCQESITRLAGLGVEFGSHGASHRDLMSCSRAELERELGDSRKRLQDLSGQSVDKISYPFGRYDRRVLDTAAQVGYVRGFTMRLPESSDNPLAVGRVPVWGFDTPVTVRWKLAPGFFHDVERIKSQVVNTLSSGTIWLNRFRR